MRFKKVYIEITNKCNLNCSFCSDDFKEKREMSIEEFKVVINKVKPYTNFVYLHVKGEPLNHSNLASILKSIKAVNLKCVITTNGTMLKKQLDTIILYKEAVRQINISIHSFMDNNLNNSYLDSVLSVTNELLDNSNIIISLRFWNNTNNKSNNFIYKKLLTYFNMLDSSKDLINNNSFKIKTNLYVNKNDVFIWPNLENEYYSEVGTCYGLINQIAILSDGTIVPCCLDCDGVINLGNIFTSDFSEIITSDKVMKMINGFKQKCKVEPLCRHCNFLEIKK